MNNPNPISEEKIFIPGPSGKLEAMIFGLPNLNKHLPDSTIKSEKPELEKHYPQAKTMGIVCHPHPLFQGTMNNKVVTTICKAWQALGVPTLRFNFRGVGESEGSYDNGIGERLDLESVLSFFQNLFPNMQFWLAGFSFGSYIALQVAGEPKNFSIAALLSVAPAIRHFEYHTLNLPNCPWVMIQGTADTLVPYEKVLQWVSSLQAQKSDLIFISMQDAEHFFHGRLVELNHIIQDKFKTIKAKY